jgi:predicted CXXCH cytochrome family protein
MPRGPFVAITLACLMTIAWSARPGTQPAQPPSAQPAQSATFVGATTCQSCHRQAHDTWKSGRHSKMIQPAGPASVKADFSKDTITLRGRRYRLRAANGEYFITESFLTGKPREHRIEYTLGSRRIQHFLTTIENGWIVILPPSWDVQRQQWFDNMEIVRPDERDETLVQLWNKNCVGCHVSQQENNYRPATKTYATKWTDFGTSCERCHGPGSAHVQAHTQAQPGGAVSDQLIVRPTRLDPTSSSMICAQCHSLRDVIAPGYVAGADYYDHFQPLLENRPQKADDPAYWADGRPRRFSNDAIGLWQSQCFLRGGATCTNCHRAHLPDVDRNPQLAPANNALCTQCHEKIGAAISEHTRHLPGSTGSACVECHMPKTVISIKATMRDHTIGVPAPENTVAFGIPNACTECHADRKASWAVDALDKWWPRGRRAKLVERAQVFTAARAQRPEVLDRLIAIGADSDQGPLIQANAVGYLGSYKDPRVLPALLAASKANHPAIRSAALSGLGQLLEGEAPRAAIVAGLDDPRRAVRTSALMSLVNRGGGPLAPADLPRFQAASREFAARARPHQDDARIQRDLGLVHLLASDVDLAAEALQISVGLEPDRPSSRFLLAMARVGQGRTEEARALLKDVPSSDPYYKAAQDSLKQLGSPK